MYEALDPFLNSDTWHRRNPGDMYLFYVALDTVVSSDGFNPNDMAAYIRSRFNIRQDQRDLPFESAIEHYKTSAWAVKDFLRYSKTARTNETAF